ncbi:hypothetical protein AB0442_23270 [Kitasatospora sp. NPDC085895]|uniref:hypothetical protein n=1 Tax=Kitasatospora sp. NPDC085895 TaxID=3155057 RepID=UPI00344F3EEA
MALPPANAARAARPWAKRSARDTFGFASAAAFAAASSSSPSNTVSSGSCAQSTRPSDSSHHDLATL